MQVTKPLHVPLLIVYLTTAWATLAQPRGGPDDPVNGIDRLAVLLDLDAYQKQEVARLLAEQRRSAAARRRELAGSGARPSSNEMQAQMQKEQEALVESLRVVLTEAQIERFTLLIAPLRSPRPPQPPASVAPIW